MAAFKPSPLPKSSIFIQSLPHLLWIYLSVTCLRLFLELFSSRPGSLGLNLWKWCPLYYSSTFHSIFSKLAVNVPYIETLLRIIFSDTFSMVKSTWLKMKKNGIRFLRPVVFIPSLLNFWDVVSDSILDDKVTVSHWKKRNGVRSLSRIVSSRSSPNLLCEALAR